MNARHLTPQQATVLKVLISSAPNVVSVEEIEGQLWKGLAPADSGHLIRGLIKDLRQLLGDSARNSKFIETIPMTGYQFIGTLEQSPPAEAAATSIQPPAGLKVVETGLPSTAVGPKTPEAVEPPSSTVSQTLPQNTVRIMLRTKLVWPLATLGLFAAGVTIYLYVRSKEPVSGRSQAQRLILNPPEKRIVSAAVSPDGRYFGYAAETGVYALAIDSHKTSRLHVLSGEPPRHISWFPDSKKLLVVTGDDRQTALCVAAIDENESGKSPLLKDVGEAAVSPDNDHIAYTNLGETSLHIFEFGHREHHLLLEGGPGETFRNLSWAGKEKLMIGRVQFGGPSLNVVIELVDTRTGKAIQVLSDPSVRGGWASSNGTLLYSTVDPEGAALLAYNLDLATGQRKGAVQALVRLQKTAIYMVSRSADGKRIAYLEGPYQADAFTGTLEKTSPPTLQNLKNLTLGESNNMPTAWKPDAPVVVFHSDRNNSWEIFAQEIGEKAELIVKGPDDYKGARFSPDGKWLLFLAYPRKSASVTDTILRGRIAMWRVQVMRIAVSGGEKSKMMTGLDLTFRCPSGTGSLCIVCKPGLMGSTLSEFDPESGEIKRSRSVSGFGPLYFDVSPDGKEIAIASSRGNDGLIRIINFQDKTSREIPVRGHPILQSMDWAPDGNGWFLSSRWAHGTELLFVEPNGTVSVLRKQLIPFETWVLPSRNGNQIAFLEWNAAGSPWLLTR